MKLGYIEVYNFFSFSEAHLNLVPGLFLVIGINEEGSNGDSSNGSGKSVLMVEAPTWLFFDKTARGIKADDVIKKGAKQCLVKSIVYDSKGKEYLIERVRDRGKGSILTINDRPSSQEELEALLGLDFNTFTSAVVHPQDFKGFADKKDKERKEVLTKILGLERFDTYKQKVKGLADSNGEEIDKFTHQFNTNTVLLEKLKVQKESLRENYRGFEDERKIKISEYEDKVDVILEKATFLKQKERQVLGLEKELQKIKKEIVVLEKTELKAKHDYDSAKGEYDNEKFNLRKLDDKCAEIEKELKKFQRLRGGKCPTCHQTVSGKEVDVCIKKWIDESKKLKGQSAKLIKTVSSAKEKYNLLCKQFDDMKDVLKTVSESYHTIKGKLEGLDLETERKLISENMGLCKRSLKEWQDKVNPYTQMEEKQEGDIKELRKEIKNIDKEIKDLAYLQPYYDFWVEGFGNAGMKSFIFDTIVPEFTMLANRYIQELSNGDITVEFDTQAEKKSGGFLEKFSINITDGVGSRPYEAWSGGEKKRISIAIDFALSDLIASKALKQWDYVAFDEILDGLDNEGKENVMSMLEAMQRKECKYLYIISHDSLLKEVFDRRIVIRKSNGDSSLVE